MHKLIEKMKEQLSAEVAEAEQKLTNGNVSFIATLSTAIINLECMEKGEWEPVADAAESVIQKYSNGRYDHNIDALYDAYIEAKKKYKEVGDQGHRDKLVKCVRDLIVEIYDMLSSMKLDSDFKEEKDEIMKYIRMLADA